MSQYPIFIAILNIVIGISFASTQCSFTSPPIEYTPFPSEIYLSYDESARFSLQDYFTGINLTFSYTTQQNPQPQPIPKIIQYTEGSLQENLPQITGSEVIDILWDDSNITQLSQSWTSDSLVLVLSGSTNSYTLTAGSFDTILSPNQSNSTFYENIPLQPPVKSPSMGSELSCSRIARVGVLEYYIDCTFSPNGVANHHYFYYISFISPPYTFKPIPNKLTLPFSPLISTRVIASTINNNGQTYLIRYYNGLKQISALPGSGIEVFNVTNSTSPQMIHYYNSSSEYSFLSNISSVLISYDYLYAISTQGSVTIFSNWYQGPKQFQQFNYDQMVFRGADLRLISFQNASQESLVVIGSLDSVNLTGLLFVSQTFQAFYSIPLPNLQQTALSFETFSVSLGDDFFGISYAVADMFSNSMCYYFAVAEILAPQPADCHTLWVHSSDDYVVYSRMNPVPNTDIMFVMRADQTFANFSIFSSTLGLLSMSETTQFNLSIEGVNSSINFSFEVIVLEPNDTNIYIDLDSEGLLQMNAFQTESNFVFFVNESIYGPQLEFGLQSQDITDYSVSTNKQLATNLSLNQGNIFISCNRQNVGANRQLLLIEQSLSNVTFKFSSVDTPNVFNISAVNVVTEITKELQLSNYFSVLGYDILYFNDTAHGLLICHLEDYLQSGNELQSMMIDMSDFAKFVDLYAMDNQDGNILVLALTTSSLYVDIFDSTNPQIISASISTIGYPFPTSVPFSPGNVIAHPYYANTAFVTTTQGNVTYVVNYSNLLDIVGDQEGSDGDDQFTEIDFVIIFAQHEASSNFDVLVQPFENNLFYIFPSLNVIEHWDLSIVKVPFFCRNLELYTYDISFVTNSFVNYGYAFSSTTDTLYLLAQDTSLNQVVVLVLKANQANSYIVNTIQLPFDLNNPQNISIDVTETKNGVYGNLLGDILVVSIGAQYYLWEVYPTNYITFSFPQESLASDNEQVPINSNYLASLTLQNVWNTTVQTVNLSLSVFANEIDIQLTSPLIDVGFNNTNSLTFGVSDYWIGTVYDFGVANRSQGKINMTSFIHFTGSTAFPSNGQAASEVLQMPKYTYYLTSDEIIITSPNGSRPSIPILGPNNCTMYIDITETYGAAICGQYGQKGFNPFSLSPFFSPFSCPFLSFPSLQDIFIDGNNSLIFLLMQAEIQGNSNLTIYNLDENLCQMQDPLFVIQGWTFSVLSPNLQQFDVLIFYSTQVVHVIFLLDTNFGLRILNYASLTNMLAVIASYSFNDIYQFFGDLPADIQYLDLRLLQNTCETSQGGPCNAGLLLIPINFHPLLLQFEFENLGLEIANVSVTVFLVPSDYQIDDYQFSDNLLIILAHNSTLANPSLDMIAYNTSNSSPYTNGIDNSDPSVYQTPIWVRPLMDDLNKYPEYPLSHPTIFLETDGSINTLTFPNMMNQTMVVYNITNNVTINWEEGLLQEGDINLFVSNNFQEVTVSIGLSLETTARIPNTDNKLVYIISGIVALLGAIIILFVICWCSKKNRHKIQYARKKQKDPLSNLLL